MQKAAGISADSSKTYSGFNYGKSYESYEKCISTHRRYASPFLFSERAKEESHCGEYLLCSASATPVLLAVLTIHPLRAWRGLKGNCGCVGDRLSPLLLNMSLYVKQNFACRLRNSALITLYGSIVFSGSRLNSPLKKAIIRVKKPLFTFTVNSDLTALPSDPVTMLPDLSTTLAEITSGFLISPI